MMIALLIAAAVILSILLAEVWCRLWFRYGARVYIWPPYYRVEMDMDPKILPHLTKHARFETNSLGARGDEPPRRGKTFHLVMAGGSGVECFALDQTENWPHLVQEYLNQPENRDALGVDRVHVSNLGKSGLTTDALCYALPRVLPHFGPIDVLTIMIGASAVNYFTRIGAPADLPAPDSLVADIEWHSEHAWGWQPKRTAAAEVVRRLRHCLRKPTVVRKGVGKRFAKSREMRKNAREMRDDYGSPTQWIRNYESSLSQAVEIAKRYARRVLLIRQPWFDKPEPTPAEAALFWHGSVGDASVEFADVFYSHRVICKLMELVDEATVRVGERTGADILEPAEAIETSAETYYDHFHMTTFGARLMGDYMGRRLLKLASIKQCEMTAARP